jgi:hypothetical protein
MTTRHPLSLLGFLLFAAVVAMPQVVAYDAPVRLTAGAPCRASQLKVTATTMSPAGTHRGVQLHFALVSTSPPCSLVGYPDVDSGAGGTALHAQRTPNGYLGGLPIGVNNPQVVDMVSGQVATAVVEGTAVSADGSPCPTYSGLQVTPPNSTVAVEVAATIATCQLQVHPVTAG